MDSQILGAHYQIHQELGKKAGRRTLLCSEQATGELVVVKLLTFNSDFEWDDLKLFEREAEALKNLSHPAIPRYLDYFEINASELKGFALVQSYIPAQSLSHHVKAGRILTEIEVKEIANAILKILIYLHRQNPPLIHRDIKPSNILLGDRSGNSVGKVYLVDFGSVQTVAAQEGATRTVVGTYGYMPPEQFGGRTVPASDLYSLGATLIYLLTGVHPTDLPQRDFRIQFEQKADLSLTFSDWLRRMCEPNLENRFDSAYQTLQALNQNPNLVAINRPLIRRIQLRKSSKFLEIFMPPEHLDFFEVLGTFIFISFAIGIGTLFLYALFDEFNMTYLLPIIFLLVYLYLLSSYFISKTLYINQEKVIFTKELFEFLKFHLAPESPREEIVKLVYFSEYVDQSENSHGNRYSVTVGAQLEIWAGIYKYKFPGVSINLPKEEVQWLAKELSTWLDLPILYADKQV
ncbi:serine/threonine protein kinase [Trichocoleus sp. DQ-A3]|uniref:serine/threonine protein kinase n=1 Tax=Cyanophyceae TaxID=3028117 RepID=UPI00168770B5|nr:serine/threonine-protein kinase [Coleofasciculus sp. FACHB-125]MBD1902653.1 serine/threonine protein kinase [Coleofasciculus sp. FACHB-125]